MSAPLYIPLFVEDYLGATIELSLEEHGAYFLLLLAAWRQDDCALPDDDRKLARICRVSMRRWKAIRPTMEAYWIAEGGRFRHIGSCTERKERRSLSIHVRRVVIERDGERCRYCGSADGPFEFDHVLPWSRGGGDTVENIVRACLPCNRAKRDYTLAELGLPHPLEERS